MVLGWLIETKRAVFEEVDEEREARAYFDAMKTVQQRNREYSSILLLDGKPVGYLCAFPMEKYPGSAWLDFCYLIPEVRGTAASGEIAARTVETARRNGCREIYLTVHRSNSRGIGFYLKNGWELDREKPDGLNRMKKILVED